MVLTQEERIKKEQELAEILGTVLPSAAMALFKELFTPSATPEIVEPTFTELVYYANISYDAQNVSTPIVIEEPVNTLTGITWSFDNADFQANLIATITGDVDFSERTYFWAPSIYMPVGDPLETATFFKGTSTSLIMTFLNNSLSGNSTGFENNPVFVKIQRFILIENP